MTVKLAEDPQSVNFQIRKSIEVARRANLWTKQKFPVTRYKVGRELRRIRHQLWGE